MTQPDPSRRSVYWRCSFRSIIAFKAVGALVFHGYVFVQPERVELSGGSVVARDELHVGLGECGFTFLHRV